MEDAGEEVIYEGFTVGGDIEISEDDLGDGIYTYSITLEDIFGGMTETDWAIIYVEGDKISCEMA